MLPEEKQMEVLEVYDLTQSYRDTAELCGVDHHTVARVVAGRARGLQVADQPLVGPELASAFIDKVDDWVTRSGGRIRADVVHDKLAAMGYAGSERTTRRVVAALKKSFRHTHHRVYKPWMAEPGGWLQYDFGAGPQLEGTTVVLFCAWLAWSRFRVVVPLADKSMPSVIAALDQSFRAIGGAPTYVLTDNEKTVTDRHIAGIAVRNRSALDVSRYYGGHHRHLCAVRPRAQRGLGGRRAGDQGRPGAHGIQPTRGLRQLRRTGRGLPPAQRRAQLPPSLRHPPGPGGNARGRARSPAPRP